MDEVRHFGAEGDLKDALDLWVEITGIDPGSTNWAMGDWNIRAMNEEMRETLRLDPGGTTTYLLLECFLRDYLSTKTFTAAQIMKNYGAHTDYLARAERLFSLVQSDDAVELAATFRARVTEALRHYGADREEVLALVNNANVLPFLRRDALRSLESLKAFQFLAGDADAERPQVIDRVYQAWDINSLLPAVRDLAVSGVALVLLRDPQHVDRSYFAFVMRNGDNVTLLTDKKLYEHPAQADMMRRPTRDFQKREWQNHFPYQLLNFTVDEDGEVVFEREDALCAAGVDLVPLLPIRDLPPHQVLWIVMMLSLISDRFWKKGWRAAALSYTADMIRVRDRMVTDAAGASLPVARSYRPITLDRLDPEEVSREAMAGQIENGTTVNAWIEERYRDRVTREAVNQWQPKPGMIAVLPAARMGDSVEVRQPAPDPFRREPAPYRLLGLSPTEFGTEEELRRDRLWTARYNMAKQLQKAADEEYLDRKAPVTRWFRGAVKKNLPFLLRTIVDGKLVSSGIDTWKLSTQHETTSFEIMRFGDMNDSVSQWYDRYRSGFGIGPWDRYAGKHNYRCAVTGAASTYRAEFQPRSANCLALLVGVEVGELPDVLRHWQREKPYIGNSILDRIDPVEAFVTDPWIKENFSVNVYLSKRGLARIRKGDFRIDDEGE